MIGVFLLFLIPTIACDVSGVVTPTPGQSIVQPGSSTAQISTIASVSFYSPGATDTSAAPVVPGATATPDASASPDGTLTPSPTIIVPGTSRKDPAPVGFIVHADKMQFFVTAILRPADEIVKSGNAYNFNIAAGAGQEYMFIKVSINCEKPADQQCTLNLFDFKALGSNGVLAGPELTIAGVDGLLKPTSFYGGATVTGYIPYIVTKGDENILLVYQALLGDTFYLALPTK